MLPVYNVRNFAVAFKILDLQSSWTFNLETNDDHLPEGDVFEELVCGLHTLNSNQGTSKSRVGPAPSCTQATVTGEYCSKEISRFLLSNSLARISRTFAGWTVTTLSDNSTATVWPPDRSFAPGCTMGCQQCRITGSSVELFWWPPQTAADDGLPVTAVGFGTTFTSPTVYISFDTLFASDSCSGVGKTYSSTILAIPNSRDISSLWGMSLVNGLQSTAAFNYTDLLHTDPVPTSIFNRQPRCVSSWWWQSTIAGPIDEYDCARDYPWRPILALPREVQAIDPEWANCVGGIEGVYDPPIALTSAQSAFKPTLPHEIPPSTTESAAPKSAHESPPVQTNPPKFTFDPITTADPPRQKTHAKPQNSEPPPQHQDPDTPQSHHHPSDSSPSSPISKTLLSLNDINPTAPHLHPSEIAEQPPTQSQTTTSQPPVPESAIVVNAHTARFASQVSPEPLPLIEIHLGSEILTAKPRGPGTPGGAVTVEGYTIRAGRGSRTQAKLTLGSQVLTAAPLPSDEVLVNGHTLSLGQGIEVFGQGFTAVREGDGKTATFEVQEVWDGRQKGSETHRENVIATSSMKVSSTHSVDAATTNSNGSSRNWKGGSSVGWMMAVLAMYMYGFPSGHPPEYYYLWPYVLGTDFCAIISPHYLITDFPQDCRRSKQLLRNTLDEIRKA
ncbi:uncharacterized protein MYCFIDRAFT_179110 [Pseudocercospora fijiensis CIRAD86]|uniref:Uncharacterized protein n=1 Tax=Pseudocercospora fijiensis (strain CIRAD86) TaxID=383855 RepID=M3AJD4_PSEFD|nr:uncharacterized protein MYCFIDRAFT_179110 [Pseudocercospora fijiensis CIRAD86]EME77592.1 hypothetical protein MYCFIDRAFT_179110 [Pseudocercospora fijiensis CIRAD86]